jgi:hypothetical protein
MMSCDGPTHSARRPLQIDSAVTRQSQFKKAGIHVSPDDQAGLLIAEARGIGFRYKV